MLTRVFGLCSILEYLVFWSIWYYKVFGILEYLVDMTRTGDLMKGKLPLLCAAQICSLQLQDQLHNDDDECWWQTDQFGEMVTALIINLIYHGMAMVVAAAAVLWRKPQWEETTDGCWRSTVNCNHSIQMTMTSDNDCNDNDYRDHDDIAHLIDRNLQIFSATVFFSPTWPILWKHSFGC